MFAEATETVMKRLGTENKRYVFRLSLQGYNITEISKQLGQYVRSVERVRAEIRALLEAIMADDRLLHA